MTGKHKRDNNSPTQGVSRRKFIKLAAMAGLLTACRPAEKLVAPTDAPTSTPAPTPTATRAPIPTFTPTATLAPKTIRRPEIIKFYPDVPSRVVRARHAGVWDDETPSPEAIQQMLDASITQLTGLNDVREAWAALFDPGERIAIKVNTIDTSDFWTRVPLVMAVTERLQEAGVPAEQIVIFDRRADELARDGYPINQDGEGVRCYGTDYKYVKGWKVAGYEVGLSKVLLSCDTLINMPVLKHHSHAGVTFAMKNHFGTFDKPALFHRPRTGRGIVGLNALPPIKERTRLIIGDALTICPTTGGRWTEAVTGDSILMSFDPVAHDVLGLQMLSEVMSAEEYKPESATKLANNWLKESAELGLGTDDPDNMELVELTFG